MTNPERCGECNAIAGNNHYSWCPKTRQVPSTAPPAAEWMERGTDEYARTIMAMGAIVMALDITKLPGATIRVEPVYGPDRQVINQFRLWFDSGVLRALCPGEYRLTIEQIKYDLDDAEPF